MVAALPVLSAKLCSAAAFIPRYGSRNLGSVVLAAPSGRTEAARWCGGCGRAAGIEQPP